MMFSVFFIFFVMKTAVSLDCSVSVGCSPGRAAADLCSFTTSGDICGACELRTKYTSFAQEGVCVATNAACLLDAASAFDPLTGVCNRSALVAPEWDCERDLKYTRASC